IVTAFIAINRHATRFSAAAEELRHRAIVNRQIRIAVEHEKFIAKQGQRAPESAARAQQLRAVERIIQPDAKPAAVAKIALNHLAEMAEAQHRPAKAAGVEQFELM